MKFNQWTVALATAGVVSLTPAVAGESSPVNSLTSGVTLSGYVDTSAIWNFATGTTQASRFANTGADRQDGFNLNAVQLALEKPLDEGTWSAGYRAELWFGPDALALPGHLGGAGGSIQAAIKQAYVALRAPVGNGIDFKIGQFDTIIGYEVASSYANPNFSRSFGFSLEPLSHTGILSTYQFTEWFGAAFGVANEGEFGNGNLQAKGTAGVRSEGVKSFLGGITVKAPESWGVLAGSSLYAGIVDGNLGSGVADTENIYVGASIATPVEGLTVGASYDYLANGKGAGSYGNAVAAYVSFQATEQLKLSYRAEVASADNDYFKTLTAGANNENLMGHTLTVDYSLWKNVVTRAELRWDRSVGGDKPFDGKANDVSLLANIVYLF
jgi:hypothetical protein